MVLIKRGLKRGLAISTLFVLVAFAASLAEAGYALSPQDLVGSKTYAQTLDSWNNNSWNDLVDSSFSSGLAAVRWYTTEGQCSGTKCEQQLHSGTNALSVSESKFYGVTDEFGNVLLSHSMGTNEDRYLALHKFSEKLRVPEINNLQCWMYYVNGKGNYTSSKDLCASKDSASDASIRILGAYGLACAKQKAGIWNKYNYCYDY